MQKLNLSLLIFSMPANLIQTFLKQLKKNLLFLAKIFIFLNSFFFLLALIPLWFVLILSLVQYLWHFQIQYLTHKVKRRIDEGYLPMFTIYLIDTVSRSYFLSAPFLKHPGSKDRIDHSSNFIMVPSTWLSHGVCAKSVTVYIAIFLS